MFWRFETIPLWFVHSSLYGRLPKIPPPMSISLRESSCWLWAAHETIWIFSKFFFQFLMQNFHPKFPTKIFQPKIFSGQKKWTAHYYLMKSLAIILTAHGLSKHRLRPLKCHTIQCSPRNFMVSPYPPAKIASVPMNSLIWTEDLVPSTKCLQLIL